MRKTYCICVTVARPLVGARGDNRRQLILFSSCCTLFGCQGYNHLFNHSLHCRETYGTWCRIRGSGVHRIP
jgi:hypothetical protein